MRQGLRSGKSNRKAKALSALLTLLFLSAAGYMAWSRFEAVQIVEGCLKDVKYVAYLPQLGMNNQLISLAQGFLLAKELNRTLLVPNVMWPRASGVDGIFEPGLPTWADVFQISSIANHLNVNFEVLQSANATKCMDIEVLFEAEKKPVYDSLAYEYLHAESLERKQISNILDLKRFSNVSTVLVDGMYHAGEIFDPDIVHDLLLLMMKPTVMMQKLLKEFQREHGIKQGYTCLHVRMKDFQKMCKEVSGGDKGCLPRCSRIEKEPGAIEDAVFIATDDIEAPSMLAECMPPKTVTSKDTEEFIRKKYSFSEQKMGVLVAVLDQLVCSEAEIMFINRMSTFSRSIDILRRERGQVIEW
eukprot:jgi/Picsp_1/2216/NSC_05680-R1_---NA---